MSPGPRDRVSRRQLVLGAGAAVLLGGCSGGREEAPGPRDDALILARALELEYRLIGAYEVMPVPYLARARGIVEQEREHAEALRRAIRALGGRPSPPPATPRRARGGGPAAVRFALSLEERAVDVYADAVARLADAELRGTAAAILASEAGHTAVLRAALGEEPVTGAFAGTGGSVP